jgi:hypothetical protein
LSAIAEKSAGPQWPALFLFHAGFVTMGRVDRRARDA